MFVRKSLAAMCFLFAMALFAAGQSTIPYPLNQPLKRPPAAAHGGAEAMSALSADEPSSLTADQKSALDDVLSLLGRGYNSFNRKTVGDCVTGTVIGPKPASNAPSYTITVVKSFDEFKSETSIEASVSGKYGAFSASVESKFSESSDDTSTHQYLLVREYVLQTPNINLLDAKLTVAPPDPANPTAAANFYRRCGDSFVSRVQMGGEFLAMVSFTESTEDLKSDLNVSASASGSYGVGSASASMDFDKKMSSLKNKQNLQVTATQIGGNTDTLPDMTLDGMMAYAKSFPAQVAHGGVDVVGLGTPEPYSNLGVDEADFGDTLAAFGRVQKALNLTSTRILQARELKALLQSYSIPGRRTPGDIVDRTDAQLKQWQADRDQLQEAVRVCSARFWIEKSCQFDAKWLNYKVSPPGPLLIASVDTRSPAVTTLTVPTTPWAMHLELRGQYCWRGGGTSDCDQDGVRRDYSKSDAGFVSVNTTALRQNLLQGLFPWYQGRPMIAGPGELQVKAVDTEYGDNDGYLEVIVY